MKIMVPVLEALTLNDYISQLKQGLAGNCEPFSHVAGL